jgi:hypothetical protein
MALPTEQILLVDRHGQRIDLDAFVERLRSEPERVLIDDQIGFVAYVGDLDVYNLTPTDNGEFLAQKVNEISRPRFSTRLLRKQIGAAVLSVTADAVFVIRDGDTLKKIRADKLEPGMVLANGDKVYR